MDRVEALLYLLMRDVMPAGKLAKVVGELATEEDFTPSSPELGALAQRYAGILRDGTADGDEEGDPVVLAVQVHEDRGGIRFTDEEGDELPPEMHAWIAESHDRVLRMPGFVGAVNEAAARRLPLTPETARLVYARARELTDEIEARSAATGGGGDG